MNIIVLLYYNWKNRLILCEWQSTFIKILLLWILVQSYICDNQKKKKNINQIIIFDKNYFDI